MDKQLYDLVKLALEADRAAEQDRETWRVVDDLLNPGLYTDEERNTSKYKDLLAKANTDYVAARNKSWILRDQVEDMAIDLGAQCASIVRDLVDRQSAETCARGKRILQETVTRLLAEAIKRSE